MREDIVLDEGRRLLTANSWFGWQLICGCLIALTLEFALVSDLQQQLSAAKNIFHTTCHLVRLEDSVLALEKATTPGDRPAMLAASKRAMAELSELERAALTTNLRSAFSTLTNWLNVAVAQPPSAERSLQQDLMSDGQVVFQEISQTISRELEFFNSKVSVIQEKQSVICERLSIFVAGQLVFLIAGCALVYRNNAEALAKVRNLVTRTTEQIADGNNPELPPEKEWEAWRVALRRVVENIAESTKKESAIFEKMADVICILDVEGRFLKVSPSCLDMWGYKPRELVGRKLSEFLNAEASNDLQAAIGASLSLNNLAFENQFLKANSELVDVSWSAYWSVKEQGLFCVAHDITARKREEALARKNEDNLRRLLSDMPVAILLFDDSGNIEFANERVLALTGVAQEEITGKLVGAVLPKLPGSEKGSVAQICEQLKGKIVDYAITRQDGSEAYVEITLAAASEYEYSKNIIAMLDVTERYEIEQTKRRFTALVSHDLRAPISSLHLIFTMYQQGVLGELSERGRYFADKGVRASESIIHLINDLLDLEKMRQGKFAVELRAEPAVKLVEDSVVLVYGLAQQKSIELRTAVDDVVCVADALRITQVLVNLLANAMKFSPANTVVDVTVKNETSGVRFSVTDKGRGIPQEKLPEIFEVYTQVSVEDGYIGSGLGLPICKSIVEQHGGKIGVESTVGKGTTFWILLPRA